MAMEEALVTRLTAVTGGATVDWFDRPRGNFDAITLTKVSPGREWTMAGPDGLDEPRVQIDCWNLTKAGVAARARAVTTEMEQARTIGSVIFHPASIELERWSKEDVAGIEGGVFRIQMDFLFNFEEV